MTTSSIVDNFSIAGIAGATTSKFSQHQGTFVAPFRISVVQNGEYDWNADNAIREWFTFSKMHIYSRFQEFHTRSTGIQ